MWVTITNYSPCNAANPIVPVAKPTKHNVYEHAASEVARPSSEFSLHDVRAEVCRLIHYRRLRSLTTAVVIAVADINGARNGWSKTSFSPSRCKRVVKTTFPSASDTESMESAPIITNLLSTTVQSASLMHAEWVPTTGILRVVNLLYSTNAPFYVPTARILPVRDHCSIDKSRTPASKLFSS